METYLLVIKGNKKEAIAAASQRNIALTVRGFHASANETRGTSKAYFDKIAAWYAETDSKGPFPIGSLLFFTINQIKGEAQ